MYTAPSFHAVTSPATVCVCVYLEEKQLFFYMHHLSRKTQPHFISLFFTHCVCVYSRTIRFALMPALLQNLIFFSTDDPLFEYYFFFQKEKDLVD